MYSLFSVGILLLAAACQIEPWPATGTRGSPRSGPNATKEVPSGREPNAAVTGTVTYRERLALTPGAALVVELRDVSYADAHALLIARQTITGPGQVPIRFNVGYHRDDIDSGNRYAIHAKIIESDGRLAFTNDTAYEVITHGNPDKVDMLLMLVQPPPDLVGEEGAGSDWRTWVEAPVHVVWANLIPKEQEPVLRVAYYQSTIEGCARPGSEGLELDGRDIIVRVTLMQPYLRPILSGVGASNIPGAVHIDVLGRPREPSFHCTWEGIRAADPDMVIVLPCGFSLEAVSAQARRLWDHPAWRALPAATRGAIWAVDASAWFSRPGPPRRRGSRGAGRHPRRPPGDRRAAGRPATHRSHVGR